MKLIKQQTNFAQPFKITPNQQTKRNSFIIHLLPLTLSLAQAKEKVAKGKIA